MRLSLGFSPCPNDTFIFDALVNNKIDTGGLEFDAVLADVETLNQWALNGKLDITKLSYGVLPSVLDKYVLLNSGSALGRGVGPLLISNRKLGIMNIEESVIAIPGIHTTAHLLFSLAYPYAKNKVFIRYDEIEDFVLAGKGLGVIIHENRFTYQSKGLNRVTDLGDHWEKKTGSSIPLGGIVAKRSIDKSISLQVDRLIRKSVEYAYEHHYKELTGYVKEHSQEMSEEVMRKHIDLYVNKYSIDLGSVGKDAVMKLFEVYEQTHRVTTGNKDIFIST
jgi:1,4-dihydroxy-6-naphthoate synthase